MWTFGKVSLYNRGLTNDPVTVSEFVFVTAGCRCRGLLYVSSSWARPLRLPTVVIVPGGKGMLSDAKDGDCGFGLLELAKDSLRFATMVAARANRKASGAATT